MDSYTGSSTFSRCYLYVVLITLFEDNDADFGQAFIRPGDLIYIGFGIVGAKSKPYICAWTPLRYLSFLSDTVYATTLLAA